MIGIDEVGRGAWAGPLLVVAARQVGDLSPELRDSKLLSVKQRQALMEGILLGCELGEGWVLSEEIDRLGLSGAMKLGVSRALQSLKASSDEEIIMDGQINYCDPDFTNVLCVIKADQQYPLVSAASIYAKVKRDTAMSLHAVEYPSYGFEKHVGYGTLQHRQALQQYGISPIHRRSYKPLQSLL